MAVVPITCREVLDLLTDYLEAALPPGLHARVERHLLECDHCTQYLDELRATIGALGALGALAEDEVPSDVRDALLTAFRTWRHDEL